jgi:hypothetical protein
VQADPRLVVDVQEDRRQNESCKEAPERDERPLQHGRARRECGP